MITIVNRNPTGRLVSLHALLQYLYAKYERNDFDLNGMKYDQNSEISILDFFILAEQNPINNEKYDPYLENPFSPAKSHLTQSLQYDTQKSKSVSDCANALEGLGFLTHKDNGRFVLSEKGVEIASLDYKDSNTFRLLREGVLKYGVFVGFLYECLRKANSNMLVRRNDIFIGFPNTEEVVVENGSKVVLSTGSQIDTMTRSKSVLFAWAITTGFCLPFGTKDLDSTVLPHMSTLTLVSKKKWLWREFQLLYNYELFNNLEIQNPLSFDSMTKSTKALRERGQSSIRDISLKYEEIVKKRRFTIVYILSKLSMEGKGLDFEKLIEKMFYFKEEFTVNEGLSEFKRVMQEEIKIATVAGIPVKKRGKLYFPVTKINPCVLARGIDKDFNIILEQIIDNLYA